MIKFIDTNLKFKKKTVENKIQLISYKGLKLPLPTEIEISESGICNRKCSFCPRSAPEFKDIKEFISQDLVENVAEQLSEINYSGTIRFSGFVEPLLDKKIFDHIKTFKNYCQNSRIEIVTNGDPLNEDRLKKLFKFGLDKILISVYDGKAEAVKFEKMIKKCKVKSDQAIIRHRYYSEDKDFGITLSNRAGEMTNAEFKIPKLLESKKQPCYIPSYTFFFDYLGDVLMCPHDWGKKVILGNLYREKLINIWFSEKSIQIRKKLNNQSL